MATIMRAILGFFVSMLISGMLERLMRPRVKEDAQVSQPPKKPYLDMKACPHCGAYTTQPCDNPNCSKL